MLLSVTRVARLMDFPTESVRRAIREKQLRAEAVVIRGRLGVAVPLSAAVEHWNLSTDLNREIELEARHADINSPVPIVTRLATTTIKPSESTAPLASKPRCGEVTIGMPALAKRGRQIVTRTTTSEVTTMDSLGNYIRSYTVAAKRLRRQSQSSYL